MSKKEKLIAKLLNSKAAFTWQELATLLGQLGYEQIEGSGSRVKFDNGDATAMINLHRPHPGNELKRYVREQVIEKLKAGGFSMAKMLEYKGYYGSIEASPEDGCLYGKLEFINALVNYEAETVPALEASFREAVDDYLADCEAQGHQPEIPCKGSFNVRIGHEAHLRAAVAAKERGMSLNDFAKQAIELLSRDAKGRLAVPPLKK